MSQGAVMTLQQERQLVAYLRAHPRLQPYVQLASVGAWPRSDAGLPSAEEFARELLGDAEFRALKLGTWLGTPDGEAVSEAVAQVIPAEYGPVFTLTVDALKLAAADQTKEGRAIALCVVMGGLLLGALIRYS
jgi:hypothetical protein